MMHNLHTSSSDGIHINILPVYNPQDSSPKQQRYLFAYRVEIINNSQDTVRLVNRAWNMMDGIGVEKTIQTPSIHDTPPCLAPGEKFIYVNGVCFSTPVGRMHGSYMLERVSDGQHFAVKAPSFLMVVPYLNN